MCIIKVYNDYCAYPIWAYDENNELTEIPQIILQDDVCKMLCQIMKNKYSSYYTFNAQSQACWFDVEREAKEKNEMDSLKRKLVQRLEEICDGTYAVLSPLV